MKDRSSQLNKEAIIRALFFVSMLLFKLACELGYSIRSARNTDMYIYDFSALKYVNGFLWCIILFLCIRHEKRKVSVFMLYLIYLMQIIPITTVYAFGNGSAVYYNTLCVSFLICEIITQWIKNIPHFFRDSTISILIILFCFLSLLFLLIYIIWKNGMPTLTALNIYKVYELRRSGAFQINKYMGYLLTCMMRVIIPFFIAKKITDRCYMSAFVFCGISFFMYLYIGAKGYLFSIPLILICTFWSKREKFYHEIFICVGVGFFFMVLLACYSPILETFFIRMYSLLGNRLLMISANLKFVYYDFFSNNPKLGFSGIFPRWLINIPNYYENVSYPNLISEIYFNLPEMYANTGFLVEGYIRFGHIGTPLIMILFALLLRLMDCMQQRAGYTLTVGAFIYAVFSLSDAYLIGTILFGEWMVILIFLLFYTPYPVQKIRIKRCRFKNNISW